MKPLDYDLECSYHILYVEDCSNLEITFKSIKEVKTFLKKFKTKHGSVEDSESGWIDYIFYGLKIAENSRFR